MGPGIGYVLESKMEKGRGAVATVILQHGVLRVGDYIHAGDVVGRVSAITNVLGAVVTEVGASMPVQLAGFDTLAQAGDRLKVINQDEFKKLRGEGSRPKVAEAVGRVQENAVNIILKVDTNSSKEALELSIAKLAKQEQQEISLIQSGIGTITESDVQFAYDSQATIYGFCVKPETHVQVFAKKLGVTIKSYYVIYHLLDDLKEIIVSMRKPQTVEKKIGEAIVRKVFNIKGMVIAGCYVKTGRIVKGCKAIVWHDGQKMGEGVIQTLQREKRAVKEVTAGFECGFVIDGFGNFNEEDKVEFFAEELVQI
jgi:translation initiation factor IF-2